MPDRPALVELVAIAARSAEAADSQSRESELFDADEELRTRESLLRECRSGLQTALVLTDGAPAARVRQALVELAAWARGIVIAYQALDRDVEGDA